jgi:hypothetical protein
MSQHLHYNPDFQDLIIRFNGKQIENMVTRR